MSVAAFLGRTERGPVDQAVAIESFDDYGRIFGGHTPLGFVSYAVQHYFLHGGEKAVVVRLANRASHAVIDVPAGGAYLHLVAKQPGASEHLRASVDYDGVENDPGRFNLVVQRVTRVGSPLVEDQELYPGLSLDPSDRRFVVDALRNSELVRLVGPLPPCRPEATLPASPGQPFAYVNVRRSGEDGEELTDYDVVGSNEAGTGLFALDRAGRIDLVCIPPPPSRDFGTTALIAAERYCRSRRALLIWDPPRSWQTSDSAIIGMRAIGFVGANAMTYFPRIRPRGQFAQFSLGLPACGALAGLFAKGDLERGYPGGMHGALKASLTTLSDLGEREAARLRRFGVNPLVRVPGGGAALDGNVCFAPEDGLDPSARRLDATRTTLHALATLEQRIERVVRALGEPEAAARVEQQIRVLLDELHSSGVLAGRNAADAYFVRVGAIAPEWFLVRFGIAITSPGVFKTYELEYSPAGVATREVPPLDAEQLVG